MSHFHVRRTILGAAFAALAAGTLPAAVAADQTVRVGLILPMSGPFASTGKEIETAVRVFQKKYGETVAGRKVEVIVKDDGNQPDVTKRLAQELITKDHVQVIAGFGLTPLAMAAAPVATQAKVPMVVMAAATSVIPTKSPYIVRTGFTLPQVTAPLADWVTAHKELKINSVITLVSDYGPGIDAEKVFVKRFTAGGGKVVGSLRAPLQNPDFAPFLQRIKDDKPDAVFIFVPSGVGTAVMKQFVERGLDKAGVRLIATGDLTDDNEMGNIGAAAKGVITSFHYSAAHDSPENKAYVAEMQKMGGLRANFHSVGGYDGMHLIYEALKKTNGDADGDKLLAAMKGASWTSVRGPVSIDPETRDIVQNVYIRRVEQLKDGGWWNVEFDKVEKFKDPGV